MANLNNNQALESQIIALKREHRDLDSAIMALAELTPADQLQIKRLKKKKLAFEVMKYLTSNQAALIRMKIGKQTVANQASYKTAFAKKDPIIQAFYKQMLNAVPTPNTPEMRLVWSPMVIALSKVFRKQATARAALVEAYGEIQKYLKKNKPKK